MYKNQLQELAQRSCFNLPSYACTREGPDHAPRFKACVNFNGEIFESPSYCTTLRQAEHAAAEVALNNLSTRGPSRSLTARVLDETGVYKNLLQETAHRAGLKLPVYTTVRSGPGHVPVFTCSVKLAGMDFTGESAKTKKQAEKNAAIAAWSSLKTMPNLVSLFGSSRYAREEQEQEQNSERRRDLLNQGGGRRMVRGQKDAVNIGYGSSSSSYHLQQHHDQQRRLMDLLVLDSSSSPSAPAVALSEEWNANPVTPMKQNLSFVSLLPPPPPTPRASSKILPPLLSSTPTRPGPPHVKGKEVPPPLDEHQKDEDEWLNNCGKSEHKSTTIPISILDQIPSKSATSRIAYRANPTYRRDYEQTHNSIRANLLAPAQITSSQLMGAISSSINNFPTNRGRYNYNGNGNGIAPAVQIRSVIPVCAAPVRPPLPYVTPPLSKTSPLAEVTTDSASLAAAPAGKVSSSELGSARISSVLKDKLQL